MTETDPTTTGGEEQGGGLATASEFDDRGAPETGEPESAEQGTREAEAVEQEAVEQEDGEQEDGEQEDGEQEDGDEGTERAPRGKASLRRLEEEGEVAADYLEELLDIADLDGDIDIDVENGRASVAIVTESGRDRELRGLVGPRGEVLEALQELARLAVQARTGERSRLMLDVAGYRAGRRRTLEDVAARAVGEVRRTGAPVQLEPMNAFERKVVHDAVAEAGLGSESEGVEPARRVVVLPSA